MGNGRPYRAWVIMLLLGIAIALAAFLRFYRLDQLPPGSTTDEASHALDALDILRGRLMLFSPRIAETPPGYMYLLAGAFQLFGVKLLVQRALTAAFGLLLVPVSYFAVRTLFRQELDHRASWTAVFTALLIATSFWAIITSRIGYEYILPSVLALIAAFFFWRGYQAEQWGQLIAAGIFTAAGFYVYDAAAPFLLVIPISVILHKLLCQKLLKPSPATPTVSWRVLIFFSLWTGMLALPLFLGLTSGPEPEVGRAIRSLWFNQTDGVGASLRLLGNSLLAHAQTFLALAGDERWRSNLPGRPLLDPLLALCFVAGILISLKRIRQLPYLFILVYWVIMLVAPVLTFGGSPLYSRMIGALPPTYIFIALAWAELYNRLKGYLASSALRQRPRLSGPAALLPMMLVGLVWLPVNVYRDYFLIWANSPEMALNFDVNTFKLIGRMEQETDLAAVFVVPWPATNPQPDFVLEFFYHGKVPVVYLRGDETQLRRVMTAELANYRTAHLIASWKVGRQQRHRDNTKPDELLLFLFEKYGRLVSREKTDAYTILTYRLPSTGVDFESHLRTAIPEDFQPLTYPVGDQVKLVGIRQQLEGNDLQIDLAWQSLTKIWENYTIFIQLLDEQGERITGIDVLPDTGFSALDSLETMITHQLVPLPAGMRPGLYTLRVGLYLWKEDKITDIGAVNLAEPVIIPAGDHSCLQTECRHSD